MYVGQEGGEARRTGCGDCKSKVRHAPPPLISHLLLPGEAGLRVLPAVRRVLLQLRPVLPWVRQVLPGQRRQRHKNQWKWLFRPGLLPVLGHPHGERGGKSVSHATPHTSAQARQEYMRMTPATAQSYVRLADNGQRIYRGRVRASLPLGTAHKPYQTLEVGQQQGYKTCPPSFLLFVSSQNLVVCRENHVPGKPWIWPVSSVLHTFIVNFKDVSFSLQITPCSDVTASF